MKASATVMNGLYNAEYVDFESAHVGDTFRIFVGLPGDVGDADGLPGIYGLDGNASFASLLATQRMLTQGGQVAPSVVVGIGYPGETFEAAMSRRNRDYVPSPPGELETRTLGNAVTVGAEPFYRFVMDELNPMLATTYGVDVNNTTLVGVSLGGLFAARVLLTRPESFARYVLASPSLWWRDEEVWRWEADYAEAHDDMKATVFLGAGALETRSQIRAAAVTIAENNVAMRPQIEAMIEWSDKHGWPRVAELTSALAQTLRARAYPGLAVTAVTLPDEDHMSVASALTSRGLRYVAGSWRPLDDADGDRPLAVG